MKNSMKNMYPLKGTMARFPRSLRNSSVSKSARREEGDVTDFEGMMEKEDEEGVGEGWRR